MARDKYEISLWEDYMVDASGDIPAHFEERKVVVIGSDTMTAACRAYEPRLVENINGTNTFTFKMFYIYRDEQTGEKRQNPFLNLLVNERKVKVFWKDNWYDLVIKNAQEDSSGKSITYTCKDLFITELSKNGFNLEFDNELENNQGTVTELGARVLEGTDWQLDEVHSDLIKQEKEEPLYSATSKAVTATNDRTGAQETIPAGATIYIFYSSVINKATPCQFLYDVTGEYKRDTNSQLIVDVPCYSFNTPGWTDTTPSVPDNLVSLMNNQVSDDFRGLRLVDSQKTILDPVTDKYVKIYTVKDNLDPVPTREANGYQPGDEIYAYESTEYKDPTFVNNLIVNNKNFSRTEGWIGTTENIVGPFQLYPAYNQTSDISTYNAKSYLKLDVVYNDQKVKIKDGLIYNAGLRESSSYIPNGIQNGEKYIFRVKVMSNSNNAPSGTYINSTLTPHIYKYTYHQGNIQIVDGATDYITIEGNWSVNGDWRECTCICNTSFSRNQIYNDNIGFFVTVSNVCWIEDVQFFPYVMGEKIVNNATVSGRINPGEMDWASVAKVYYHYYNHTTHSGVIELDDYLYVGTTDWSNKSDIEEVSNNFAKVRSITARQSNRFNLLQTLAETFECWCQFKIEHDSTGRVVYINGKPKKTVCFKEKIGKEIGFGFIYGIDLKTISRTIQSDQIVTKTIVSQNNNEFATNGFCTIARSPENYARDTFILNFDYFISQGLLDGGQLNKDLYSWFQWVDTKGNQKGYANKGYYTQLRELNVEFDEITDLLVQKKTELTKQQSYKTVYENYITSLQEEKINIENYIMQLANVTTWAEVNVYVKANPDQQEIKTRMNARENCINNLNAYQAMLTGITQSLNNLTSVINLKEERQKELTNSLKELNWAFFRKYSRFIQEGSWIKEDYIDDTLYFLDAQSVAYTSSRPQISYNISVARLSSLEEFKSKVFHLGDISYVQDTEFFGYVVKEGINTPYKEKVLISEVTSNFDDPVQDTFKVQNYKTQFEDLFQRITATTQSLQYASGEYARAANVVETNGVIKPETLQNSIAYSNALVIEANNEQILQDNTGIMVTDATNRNKRTKITSGGVFISTDGGTTWKNAIRGEGIATQYLTSGNINTQDITLLDGVYQTFRWDSTGINAYAQLKNQQGQLYGIDLSKAVRFDHYGVYGINNVNGDASAYVPLDENDIWNKAAFGMTWKGFFVKNKYGDHYVEVSSENDIQVVDTSGENDVTRVKIGKFLISGDGTDLSPYVYGYGIVIKDESGNSVMQTGSDGKLWLQNELKVGNGTTSTVTMGYDPNTVRQNTGFHEVFHAGVENSDNEFVVYEDGYIKASGGIFTGAIYATGGQIGNMTIGEVQSGAAAGEKAKRIYLQSNMGYTFTTTEDGTDPSSIVLNVIASGFDLPDNAVIVWSRSADLETWTTISEVTSTSYTLTYTNFKNWSMNSNYYIRASYNDDNKTYVDLITINEVKDGESPVIVQIESSTGTLFLNHNITARLTAIVYKGGQDITNTLNDSVFTWKKYSSDGTEEISAEWPKTGVKYIEIDENDIYQKAKFSCTVTI